MLQAEVLRSLDTVQEERRLRLQAVPTGLPAALWSVVLIGAVLNIGLTYLFWVENLTVHAILVAILAIFICVLVFLTAAMDNPFRGQFSVSADAYQTVLDNVMSRERLTDDRTVLRENTASRRASRPPRDAMRPCRIPGGSLAR